MTSLDCCWLLSTGIHKEGRGSHQVSDLQGKKEKVWYSGTVEHSDCPTGNTGAPVSVMNLHTTNFRLESEITEIVAIIFIILILYSGEIILMLWYNIDFVFSGD